MAEIVKTFDIQRFARIVLDLRLKHRLKQDDLADYIGIKRASYSGVERAIFGPGDKVKLGIYNYYRELGEDLTMDYLFGVDESPNEKISKHETEWKEKLENQILEYEDKIKNLESDLRRKDEQVSKLIDKLTSDG